MRLSSVKCIKRECFVILSNILNAVSVGSVYWAVYFILLTSTNNIQNREQTFPADKNDKKNPAEDRTTNDVDR